MSKFQQIVGRAIRYKSHSHLPERQRKVDVYFMKLVHPTGIYRQDSVMSGDVRLYQLINEKREQSKQITNILKQNSI